MCEKQDKSLRILDMFIRLSEGKIINAAEEAERFGVDVRSIQRDISDINKFLSDRVATNPGEDRTVIYYRSKKGFEMTGNKDALMSNSEILAVCKILLESRAFTKREIESILDKLIAGCVPLGNMKLVSDLIANEKFHYVELRNSSAIQDKLWEIGTEIKKQNLLEIGYRRGGDEGKVVSNVIEPLAIIFSEYYFYLIANIVKKNKKGIYSHIYQYPAVYRVDRIIEYREIGEKFRINYGDRFEDGEFRKRIQFMFQGELIKLQFRYVGRNTEAILDRLPTARVVSKNEKEQIMEAEVYGKGILPWLLGLGTMVEVLKPESVRKEIKEKISNMNRMYLDDK